MNGGRTKLFSGSIDIPGITMSPKPNILNWRVSANKSLGNNNLIGASKDLATVTITSVANTQKIS